MIRFNNVTATYPNGSGIFNISFEVKKSEMLFLIFYSDGFFRVSGSTDREAPDLFCDRALISRVTGRSFRTRGSSGTMVVR